MKEYTAFDQIVQDVHTAKLKGVKLKRPCRQFLALAGHYQAIGQEFSLHLLGEKDYRNARDGIKAVRAVHIDLGDFLYAHGSLLVRKDPAMTGLTLNDVRNMAGGLALANFADVGYFIALREYAANQPSYGGGAEARDLQAFGSRMLGSAIRTAGYVAVNTSAKTEAQAWNDLPPVSKATSRVLKNRALVTLIQYNDGTHDFKLDAATLSLLRDEINKEAVSRVTDGIGQNAELLDKIFAAPTEEAASLIIANWKKFDDLYFASLATHPHGIICGELELIGEAARPLAKSILRDINREAAMQPRPLAYAPTRPEAAQVFSLEAARAARKNPDLA